MDKKFNNSKIFRTSKKIRKKNNLIRNYHFSFENKNFNSRLIFSFCDEKIEIEIDFFISR